MLPRVDSNARPLRHAFPVGRYLLLTAIGLYAFAVPWTGNVLIPRGIRTFLFNQRSYWVALFVGISVALYLLSAAGQLTRRLENQFVRRVFFASLVFPVYYTATGLFKDRLSVPVVGLYATWALFSFLLIPLLVQSRRDLRFIVLLLTIGLGVTWFGSFVGATNAGVVTVVLHERLSYGFMNANDFAKICQMFVTVFVLFLLLAPDERPSKQRSLMVSLVFAAAMVFAFMAIARAVIVSLIVTGLSYQMLKRERRPVVLVSFVLVGLMGATFFLLLTTEVEMLDDVSSGRTFLWRYIAGKVLEKDEAALSLLFGTKAPIATLGEGYSDIADAKRFFKAHYDNFYLEMMIEGGLVGTILFLLPYLFILRRAFRRVRGGSIWRAQAWVTSVYFGVAVQGLFTSTIPSFNASLGLTFAVISFVPFLVDGETEPRPGVC